MTSFARKLAFSVATACLLFSMGASPALAKTAHHKHVAKSHHSRTVSKSRAAKAKGSAVVRIAQDHLSNLGYYAGKIDGKMGAQTKAAIKRFQREHGLKVDGALNSKTQAALEKADHRVIGSRSQLLTRDTYGSEPADVHPDYAASLNNGTKVISSRFARLDVNESGYGAGKRYLVNLNGSPILTADGQPSVIGVSQTYDLGNEDAVVFTTYSPNENGCVYRTHVLAMNGNGNKLLDVENCTRTFQAHVDNGSLFISFPEYDDARTFGATWRLDGQALQRL